MAKPVGIEVEGLREFQREVRRAVDSDLPKRLGQANKRVGEFIASRLQPQPDPRAVGTGAGATVRPSASKRDVLLRVGGKHREVPGHPRFTKMQPWGKRRVVKPGRNVPKRPYIKETADRHYDKIAAMYLDGILEAMDPAFHDTSK